MSSFSQSFRCAISTMRWIDRVGRIVRTLDVFILREDLEGLMWQVGVGIVRAVGLHHQSVGDKLQLGSLSKRDERSKKEDR